jgi:hypothetical protein
MPLPLLSGIVYIRLTSIIAGEYSLIAPQLMACHFHKQQLHVNFISFIQAAHKKHVHLHPILLILHQAV